jgi:hypothetical protein
VPLLFLIEGVWEGALAAQLQAVRPTPTCDRRREHDEAAFEVARVCHTPKRCIHSSPCRCHRGLARPSEGPLAQAERWSVLQRDWLLAYAFEMASEVAGAPGPPSHPLSVDKEHRSDVSAVEQQVGLDVSPCPARV